MSKDSVFLIYGAEGSQRDLLISNLIKVSKSLNLSPEFKSLKDYIFVPTLVTIPKVIEGVYQALSEHYEITAPFEFRLGHVQKKYLISWKECLDKQIAYDGSDIADNYDYVYKAIPKLDAYQDKGKNGTRKYLINVSNSTGAEYFPSQFNALMELVNLLKNSYNIKVVLTRSSKENVERGLKESKIYNEDETETLLVHHQFIEKEKSIVKLRKELIQSGNIPLTFIDITNNAEVDAKRLYKLLETTTIEENDPYYESKHVALEYLSKNRIRELMQYMLQILLIDQPENPHEFLVKVLKDLKAKQQPKIFSLTNFETMFSMVDINSQGFLTKDQVIKTLINLNVEEYLAHQVLSNFSQTDKITQQQFVNIMSKHLDILMDTPFQ
ncbi:hypothetical protein ABK040_014368 [Willaertia magna]